MYLDVTELHRDPRAPRIVKFNAIDRGNDVDTNRRNADLKNNARLGQVILREVVKWCSECSEGMENVECILFGGAYPDVEVLGRPNVAMRSERVCSDHQVFSARVVQRG